MSAPFVSVVVPTYNASVHVEDMLDTVLAQTLRELEIVVVDDGSTDDTRQRVERMARRDSRIRLLTNDRNRGPSFTRNAAIAAARGEWIAILDADDRMQRARLEVLTEAAVGAGVDVIADDILFVQAPGAPVFDRLLPATLFNSGPLQQLDAESFLRMNPPGGTRGIGLIKPIIRSSILRETGIRYRDEMRLAEDLFFYLELIMAGASVAVFERGMYEYLVRPDSLSRSRSEADIVRMIESYDRMLDDGVARQNLRVMELLRQHRDEMTTYSLPKFRLVQALRTGQLSAGLKLLWCHPRLPLQMLRRRRLA